MHPSAPGKYKQRSETCWQTNLSADSSSILSKLYFRVQSGISRPEHCCSTVWLQCSTFQAGSVQQHYCIDCILGLFSNTYVAMLWFIAELDYGLWRRIFFKVKISNTCVHLPTSTQCFLPQHAACIDGSSNKIRCKHS